MVKTSSKKITRQTNPEVVFKKKDLDETDKNVFKVPMAQRKKRGYLGHRTFNDMYQLMGFNCDLFLHPKVSMKVFCPETRKTTARNAARMAACTAEDIVDEMMAPQPTGKIKN